MSGITSPCICENVKLEVGVHNLQILFLKPFIPVTYTYSEQMVCNIFAKIPLGQN